VRPKYRHKTDRSRPPVVAPALERPVSGGYASAGLLAWIALSKRYGKLPFEDLFEAGIRYARESFMVSPITAASWARQAPNY
jgi:gamma-glutamyltranspeptidase